VRDRDHRCSVLATPENHVIWKITHRHLPYARIFDSVDRASEIRKALDQRKYFVDLVEESVREVLISRSIPFDCFAQVALCSRPKSHRFQRESTSRRISSIAARQSSSLSGSASASLNRRLISVAQAARTSSCSSSRLARSSEAILARSSGFRCSASSSSRLASRVIGSFYNRAFGPCQSEATDSRSESSRLAGSLRSAVLVASIPTYILAQCDSVLANLVVERVSRDAEALGGAVDDAVFFFEDACDVARFDLGQR
jgi:hypothetical protein